MANTLPGNPYLEDATGLTAEASLIQSWSDEERSILAQQGTTYATLALAYEQRTANLIAVHRLAFQRGLFVDTIEEQVFARLGLDEVQA